MEIKERVGIVREAKQARLDGNTSQRLQAAQVLLLVEILKAIKLGGPL